MNYRYITILTAALVLSLALTSCGAKKSVSTEIMQPPIVSLHPSVQKIGILNRSIPSEKNAGLDDVDKILSIEGANLDAEGALQAIVALQNELSKNQKFTDITTINSTTISNPGGGVFPAALSWDEVAALCKTHTVDALFVLSIYDTDATVSYDTRATEITGPLGIKIPSLEHTVTINTQIKTGWRVYDPVTKTIRDELAVNRRTSSSGSGINPIKAIEAAKNRKQAVLQISRNIGERYASRTFPYKKRIYRDYYTKATSNFEIARRNVETGQWDKAAALWLKETNNSDPEVAGKACFNMAFYNEIKGDYTKAIEWATQAYTDFELKKGLEYLDDLKQGLHSQQQLKH